MAALASRFAEMEAELSRWGVDQTRVLHADLASQQQQHADNKENVVAAQSRVDALEHEADEQARGTQVLLERHHALEAEVNGLAAEGQRRAAVIAQQHARAADLEAERAALQAEVAGLRRGSVEAAQAKEALLSVYESQLGLRFQRTRDGLLKFVFTKIDETKLEREFSFDVRIDEQGHYSVGKCRPAVAGLALLVDVLNETNDLGAFVRSLRDKFRDSL